MPFSTNLYMGIRFHTGDGVKQDYVKAKSYYEKAIAEECADAYRHMGLLYEDGLVVGKDLVTAAKYYQQSLERGYAAAQEDLDRLLNSADITGDDLIKIGIMYCEDNEIKANSTDGIRWFTKAAEKGSAYACFGLGRAYEEGEDVGKNLVTAAKYYQQALEGGYKDAQEYLDRVFSDATADDLDQIGVLYANADGVTRGYAKAKYWQDEAIRKGSIAAYRNIGVLYENGGDGITQNFVTAAKYFQQAKDKGYEDAQEDLDRLFSNATADDLDQIGVLYANADGVTRDYAKANYWQDEAIRKGSIAAYRHIGMLYENGGHGITQNFITAAKYFQQAKEKGTVNASKI